MIIRHDRSDRECLVDAADWPAFTTFFNGHAAATLIAPRWFLTAAHVATLIPDGRLSVPIAGQRHKLGRVVVHPDFRSEWEPEDELEEADVPDLAVVELLTPVEDVDPVALYEGDGECGMVVTLLGSGESGNGLRHVRAADRHLRRATNRI